MAAGAAFALWRPRADDGRQWFDAWYNKPGERDMNRFVKVLLGAVVLGAGSAGLWLNGATAVAAGEPPSPVTLKGDAIEVLSVAYSPDGKTLASGSETVRSSCGTWRRARNRPPSRDTT